VGSRRDCGLSCEKLQALTHDTIVTLAVLGVAGQALAAVVLLAGASAVVGIRQPLAWIRSALWGYELWAAFVVAAIATGGSLFFSEIAHFVPCELCWYQRICMYPLSLITLLAAAAGDFRVARYLLPLPVVGAGVSVYHLLVENGVVAQSTACLVSAPGGCATKWIDEFGYMTIPTLALTAFVLLIELLGFAAAGAAVDGATLDGDAER
jgi:disulfide bond formation protein DsbB